ncbi:response regulator [Fulvivirgaceae bacterium BMA10]|uniref:Response regulator n=1 Tax=Splendidivirga corallicola TaxID=3051826 RepID=A0ABT8KHJ6_9BACT|nr:response regulator [Fulvivirgaceae bacterium BMA10]
MTLNKPILLVEDDVVDQMTVTRSLKELNVANELYVANNGEEGLDVLKSNNEKPGLILLDLNMPKMNGIEFLQIIKTDDNFKMIPVVVLTTSKQEKDKVESFNLGIAGYMVKPVDYDQFLDIMKSIHHYWSTSETL